MNTIIVDTSDSVVVYAPSTVKFETIDLYTAPQGTVNIVIDKVASIFSMGKMFHNGVEKHICSIVMVNSIGYYVEGTIDEVTKRLWPPRPQFKPV